MSLTRLLSHLPEPLFSTYSIERVLGVGAYAVVYQVRDKYSSEAFALKVVEKEPMRVRAMLPQLAREASLLQAHAEADSPHVVQLLEVTTTPTHLFLRFELCQQSLEDLAESHGPMAEEDAFRWLRQACLGVQALHATGVTHRDLKPSNFLVDSEDMLQICDFGWACMERDALTGQCGTPDYSPPETRGDSFSVHTHKVDIYGLGASLQHLLLGRVPKGPSDLPKGLSATTRELLGELMDSDPDGRPSIDDLLARPPLAEGIIVQLLNQWRSVFGGLNVSPKEKHSQKQIEEDMSCGLVGMS